MEGGRPRRIERYARRQHRAGLIFQLAKPTIRSKKIFLVNVSYSLSSAVFYFWVRITGRGSTEEKSMTAPVTYLLPCKPIIGSRLDC